VCHPVFPWSNLFSLAQSSPDWPLLKARVAR
jgi:hypothetical protein